MKGKLEKGKGYHQDDQLGGSRSGQERMVALTKVAVGLYIIRVVNYNMRLGTKLLFSRYSHRPFLFDFGRLSRFG